MLRYSFLPSDFNPMLLILGEREDMLVLASALYDLSVHGREMNLTSIAMPSDTDVSISRAERAKGLVQREPRTKTFAWILDATAAYNFACEIRRMCNPGALSGSARLLCGKQHEIPVKLSFGEFPEEFLVATPAV